MTDPVVRHVTGNAARLLSISHALHADPEVAWREHRAAGLLTEELRALGFDVTTGVAGLDTAFTATLGAGDRHIGVIAEYDALPGLGHACGHNIIAAAAVGAGAALAAVATDARITVIGTPAEEGGGGKIHMLDAGVFDDVDTGVMIHPGPQDSLYAHPYAVAHFDVVYDGKGAHAAAYPHLGRNAADAFTIAQVAIGLLRQQLPDRVRIHGVVTDAGTAPNAIPERARGHWYVRAHDLCALAVVFDQVADCFRAGALATGCTLTMRETSPRYSEFRNDERLAAAFDRRAAARGRTMNRGRSGMNTASTDMGNVSQRVRAIHPYLGIDSAPAVNHQREFADAAVTAAADRAVIDGAILLAQTVLDDLVLEDTGQQYGARGHTSSALQ